MANIQLIQQKLPQDLREQAKEFVVPDDFLSNSSDFLVSNLGFY